MCPPRPDAATRAPRRAYTAARGPAPGAQTRATSCAVACGRMSDATIERLRAFDPFASSRRDGAPGGADDGAGTSLPYLVLDVFTDVPLTGNQLAVFTDGRGLSGETMQRI